MKYSNLSVVDFSVPTKKRDGYLEWSDYFMAIAFLSAQRSKDPKTQVQPPLMDHSDQFQIISASKKKKK